MLILLFHICIIVPPKDVCLYINEDQSKQITKKIGEEWKDGKCKTCLCENSDNGPKTNCLLTECSSMSAHPDINDYVLEEILLDNKCCPIQIVCVCVCVCVCVYVCVCVCVYKIFLSVIIKI